ncbi:MAG: hypothetical protein NT013_10290 [Planctomycetia bacterium]|nr:hypothetical protein [Planctomycetia bacterium]
MLSVTAGNAISCQPSQILASFIENITNNADFIGEPIHGVGQPLQPLRSL